MDVKNTALAMLSRIVASIKDESEPDSEYRRIRISSEAFQKRVAAAKGGCEFLQAIGFKEEQQSVNDGGPLEPFYVMSASIAEDKEQLSRALDALFNGKPILAKPTKNASIYSIHNTQLLAIPRIFNGADRDEEETQVSNKYTLIRVGLPDNYVIEGIFSSLNPLSEVRNFVSNYMSEEVANTSWFFKKPMTQCRLNEKNTLGSLGLIPAAVLHIIFDEPINGPTLSKDNRKDAKPFVI